MNKNFSYSIFHQISAFLVVCLLSTNSNAVTITYNNEHPCPKFTQQIREYYEALIVDSNASKERQKFYRDMIDINTNLFQAMDCDAVELRKALRRIKRPDIIERKEFLQ